MAKKNARSLGCTWNKPYYLQPKEQELRIFIPHSYGMCQKWWSQRTHVLINDDFHPTHQLPDFSQFFGQKPHINFQTSLVFPKFSQNPWVAPALFRFASPHQLPRHQLQRPPLQQLHCAALRAAQIQRRASAAVDPSQAVDAAVERLGCTMVTMDLDETGGKYGDILEDFSELMLIFMGHLDGSNWLNELKCWFLLGTWWKHQEKGWFLTGFWQDDFVDFHLNVMGFCW